MFRILNFPGFFVFVFVFLMLYQNSYLNRAPVLVALALIEGGMKYADSTVHKTKVSRSF